MQDLSLVGKCGLYCGACTIYRAERDSQEWRSHLASKFNCTAEQVKCNGCGSLTSVCWGSGCKIVVCVSAKSYDFCYQCDDYKNNDCDRFSNLAKRYGESSNVDLRGNLSMIENGETQNWIEQSKERFTCRNCRNPIAAGISKCHHCNAEL